MERISLAVLASILLAAAPSYARPIMVFLDRDGGKDGRAEIPPFGGDDATWESVVSCVQRDYAPFDVDIVEQRPAKGPYITAMFGGRASLLGNDDTTTGGISPYNGRAVLYNAVVHVFSENADGASNVDYLCATAAHEIGHALGLDHELYCGDLMSYCEPREFIDVTVPCGETKRRVCGNGDGKQNSYRRLIAHVGLRKQRPAS